MVECCKDVFLLNGEIKRSEEFKESWLKTKGAVYEVFRLLNGEPFRPGDNIERFKKSLSLIDYEYAVNEDKIISRIEELARINNVHQGNVKYVLFKHNGGFSELIFFIPHHYPTDKELQDGVETLLLHAKRANPTIKIINTDLRELANSIIDEENVFEVLLVNDLGYVTEGSRSNFFLVKNNIVYTPPIGTVLPGTVRKRVIEICKKHNIDIVEKNIHYSRLKEYNAAFLTATSLGVLPIYSINEEYFDVDNTVLRLLQKEYFKLLK